MDCEILGTRQLLENRTKASRGEIEMVETLEELKELNKRKVVVNYDGMLGQFEVQRQIELETEAARQEDEDEQVFARRHYTNSLSFWPSPSVDAAIGDERAAPLLLAAVHRWRLCSSSGFWNLFDVCSLFQSNRSLSESCIKSEWIFSINVCNLKKIQCAADPERLWRTHRGRPRHQTVGRGQRRRRRRRRAPASVGQEAPGGGPRGGHGPAFLLRRPFQQKEARLSRARQKERPHCILGSILCGILCSILIWSAIVCTLYLFLSVTLKEIESHVSIDLDGYEVPFGVYLLLRQPS